MMVTGCSKWYLGVLVLGVEFKWFEIERDEAEIEALRKSEADFWEYVKSGEAPMVDGSKSTSETISTIYRESNGNEVSLMAYQTDLTRYAELSALIKDMETQKDEVANRIKVFMGEAEKGECDKYKVSWASSMRVSFDHKRFAKENPDIDLSDYYKATATRMFKVNEIK
jgi:predicted phage-related endonuclease